MAGSVNKVILVGNLVQTLMCAAQDSRPSSI